ncbi:hypothetical protein Tco_0776681 [Tanacetum coccineum]
MYRILNDSFRARESLLEADEELSDGGFPRVIVYGYDGLPMQPEAPLSLDYVPGLEHLPSPNYVPGPKHPPSPVEIYSMAGEDEFHDDNPPPPPPPVTPTQQVPHTLSTIKLRILKKGKYDIWSMKIEHYLGHTDYPIWEVIQKRNGPVQVSTDTNGQIRVLPLKTAEEILARERERKARTTLLMSILEDYFSKI